MAAVLALNISTRILGLSLSFNDQKTFKKITFFVTDTKGR